MNFFPAWSISHGNRVKQVTKKAKFSPPEAVSLLYGLDIILVEWNDYFFGKKEFNIDKRINLYTLEIINTADESGV